MVTFSFGTGHGQHSEQLSCQERKSAGECVESVEMAESERPQTVYPRFIFVFLSFGLFDVDERSIHSSAPCRDQAKTLFLRAQAQHE